MNWINGFELLCYILSAVLMVDMVRRKNLPEIRLFLSGALAGYTLELLAVRVTDIYYYSPQFWLNLGSAPYQFPVFGGLMWGGLTVCALRIAERFGFSDIKTALTAGFLIVSMDLFLDVAAIRLDGGFWTWAGREINTEITHLMFMSVIWVNFLGYLFETPMVVWLYLKDRKKSAGWSAGRQIISVLMNALGGIAFVGAASLLSLWVNSISDEWFACIAFLLVYGSVLVTVLHGLPACSLKNHKTEGLAVAFFAAMYLYCFVALIHLGIFRVHPWLMALCVILFLLCAAAGGIADIHKRH